MVSSIPLISIIVPNYNHEKFLKQRLESIFNQTYGHFEVLLLDDCSSDSSKNILAEYAKNPKVSHCLFNETNSGNTFIQWNKGIALATGDFIWIAESDDFCELNFLEELIQPLLHDDEIVLSYCQSKRVDEFNAIKGNWLNHTDSLDNIFFLKNFILGGNEFIQRFLIFRNVIPNASGVLFRTNKALSLGVLETDSFLRYCGDWLFYMKLITNNKVAFISTALNCYRFHPKSVIAMAHKSGKFDSYNGVHINVRKKMKAFLLDKKPYNLGTILKINKQISNDLKYEKAFHLIRNQEKIKGFLLLILIFRTFVIKYKFKKNLELRVNKMFFKNSL
ncbi:glycosyltransferase family 2 protein [Flavobacterium sp. LB2P44]|uniref:glycosyltransferase family 2 protein n=1 Tax=Flavobacterium sp. LB2P44 TaxID=3401713 RepID=UPI003AAD8CA8